MATLPCPPELWPEFSALLDQALDLPEKERRRWLQALPSKHIAVRPWLMQLLTGTIERPHAGFMMGLVIDSGAAEELSPVDFRKGQQLGPYLLQRHLGSGGMGEVWLASRSDGSLNRQVALKLPHAHLMAGVLRRRFERERDILAGFSHPNIAQLYDAGLADSQHPYLAMEWVDGAPIHEHCRAAKLALEGRLELFLQILDAVAYAHERLIAHRDLKPSNILVTGEGRVKLLDFGIAKLLRGDTENGATELTRVGACMATPGYAAPEQLAGKPITVAVDVYALGVILYELLTGRRPYDSTNRGTAERDTPRASSQIEAGHAACVGGLNARQLRRGLNGDLDAILAKALEADPAGRYHSAEAFALDIYLSRRHRPISARHIGAAVLTLKFVHRHRLGVSMTLSLLLVLMGGLAGTAWQAVRAASEAQRATTIKDFLVGVFRASDPRVAADKPRGEITARELLNISTRQIESAFADQRDTEIELLGVAADIYRELDETQRSTALYARETELAGRYHDAANPRAIDGLLGQANNADHDGDDARSLLLLAKADPLISQAHLEKSAVRARWLLMRGEALMDDAARGDDARTALEAAAALFKTAAPGDALYPEALANLGALFLDQSKFARSADYYRQAIAVAEPNKRLQGDLLLAYAGLALALENVGDFDGAAAAFEHGTQIAGRTYGHDSHHYWVIASDWAQFRYERGERQEALAAFETLRQSLPENGSGFHNATDALESALVLRKYGRCLANDGQGQRSRDLLERASALFNKAATHPPDAALLQLDLGSAYEADGRIPEARQAFLTALQTLEAQKAPPSQRADAHERWARFLLSQGDSPGAATEFKEALRLAEGPFRASAILAQAGLAAIAVSLGDAQAALDISRHAIEQFSHIEDYYDVRIQPYLWSIRARSLRLAGDIEGARAFAQRSRDAALLYYSPGGGAIADAEGLLKDISGHASPR